MKPEKSSLKKTVKNVTKSIRKSAASVAARLTQAPASTLAAAAPRQPIKTSTPKAAKPKSRRP